MCVFVYRQYGTKRLLSQKKLNLTNKIKINEKHKTLVLLIDTVQTLSNITHKHSTLSINRVRAEQSRNNI